VRGKIANFSRIAKLQIKKGIKLWEQNYKLQIYAFLKGMLFRGKNVYSGIIFCVVTIGSARRALMSGKAERAVGGQVRSGQRAGPVGAASRPSWQEPSLYSQIEHGATMELQLHNRRWTSALNECRSAPLRTPHYTHGTKAGSIVILTLCSPQPNQAIQPARDQIASIPQKSKSGCFYVLFKLWNAAQPFRNRLKSAILERDSLLPDWNS